MSENKPGMNPLTQVARALLGQKVVTREQLLAAQAAAKESGGIFASVLIKAGVPQAAVLRAHAEAYGLPLADPASLEAGAAQRQLQALPPAVKANFERLIAVPIGRDAEGLLVAFAQAAWVNTAAAKALPAHKACLAGEEAIRRLLQQAPSPAASIASAPASLAQAGAAGAAGGAPETQLFAGGAAGGPPKASASGNPPPALAQGSVGSTQAFGISAPAVVGAAQNLVSPPQRPGPPLAHSPSPSPSPSPSVPSAGGPPSAAGRLPVASPSQAAGPSTGTASFGGVPSSGVDLLEDNEPAFVVLGPGARLGEFTLSQELGGGGMATVYLAQGADGHEVALKVMQSQLANDPNFVQRFIHEVRATIDLHHGNVVEVYSYGQDSGHYWMASEFVDGGTVEGLLGKTLRMPAPLAVEIFAQLVAGLHFAHSKGIIHRDVKPANLLLTRNGVLKIADFGIAKTVGGAALTQTGMLVGTPAYMSPEQARGEALDARSDLYAAGIVLYELLSGTNPNQADDAAATVGRLLKGVVTPIYELEPTVPPMVEALLEGLLCADPELRPSSGEEILELLAPYLKETRGRYPQLLAEAISSPDVKVPAVTKGEATAWLKKGQEMLGKGPSERRQAALAIYRAVLGDPENREATALLEELCKKESITFQQSSNPKVSELEALLADDPENPGILQRLANLYRSEGNLFRAVTYYKRYLRLRPDDGYAQGQLSLLTGQSIVTPEFKRRAASARGKGSGTRPPGAAASTGALPMGADTAALVQGVHTGGFQAAAAVPVGTTIVPAPELEAAASVMDYVRAIVSAWGLKLVLVAAGVAVLYFGYRSLNRFIADATVEAGTAAEDLHKNLESQENQALTAGHIKAMQARAASAGAEAASLLAKGMAAYRGGHFDQAVEHFKDLESRYPKRPQAAEGSYYRAMALMGSEDYGDAGRAFHDFMNLHAGSDHYIDALMGVAQAYFAQGRLPEAIDGCSRLLQDHASSPLARQARVLRAKAYEDSGNREAAIADYQEILGRTAPSTPYYDKAKQGLSRLGVGP